MAGQGLGQGLGQRQGQRDKGKRRRKRERHASGIRHQASREVKLLPGGKIVTGDK